MFWRNTMLADAHIKFWLNVLLCIKNLFVSIVMLELGSVTVLTVENEIIPCLDKLLDEVLDIGFGVIWWYLFVVTAASMLSVYHTAWTAAYVLKHPTFCVNVLLDILTAAHIIEVEVKLVVYGTLVYKYNDNTFEPLNAEFWVNVFWWIRIEPLKDDALSIWISPKKLLHLVNVLPYISILDDLAFTGDFWHFYLIIELTNIIDYSLIIITPIEIKKYFWLFELLYFENK